MISIKEPNEGRLHSSLHNELNKIGTNIKLWVSSQQDYKTKSRTQFWILLSLYHTAQITGLGAKSNLFPLD